MQLKNSGGSVVCKVYDTPAAKKPVAKNCPAGTWTEQLFDSGWKQIGKNKQVSVGQTSEPPRPGTGTYEGSAAAVHMQLKNSGGSVVCKVYDTPAAKKPVAKNCPAGTWTEQLFDAGWKQIGKNKQVRVDGGTVDPGQQNLNRKMLDGSKAERYWTAEKMEAAKDVKTGKAVSTQRSAAGAKASIAVPAHMERRTGRLFFTVPNLGDSSCTGSVVNSPGGDTVWTAGHCVHLNGSWATNVLFVPGYDRGEAPYGTWSARQLWSLYGWTKGGQATQSCGTSLTGGDLRYDLGVVVLNQRNGKSIVSTVGGNGLRVNQTMNFPVKAYAYDGTTGSNNDGCDGSVATSEKLITGCASGSSNPGGRAGFFAVSCSEIGPGSSGGGIFKDNHLVGVLSHSSSSYPGYHYSPLFGQGALNLYNAIGHFAAADEAVCKALFLGGVTRRFPGLNFSFLEGGVGWACQLLHDLIEHWEVRNPDALDRVNPANLDYALLNELAGKHGTEQMQAAVAKRLARPRNPKEGLVAGRPAPDDFAACEIDQSSDFLDLFVKPFWFGCEAEDRLAAWAFKDEHNALGARLKATLGSDIGHFDVTDMSKVLVEAHELVDDGLMTDNDFRDFTFNNTVQLLGGQNPDFFTGTVVEKQAAEALEVAAG